MDLNKLYLNAPHSMGTTIIGVTYNGGVVLGAYSRTSTASLTCVEDELSERVKWWQVASQFGEFSSLTCVEDELSERVK
ncbi:hypothetical protein I3843_08G091000 [Carya illinoinensis]|nr:hypothetical protein I3843_08G091000 [Carya illinoinensis]